MLHALDTLRARVEVVERKVEAEGVAAQQVGSPLNPS